MKNIAIISEYNLFHNGHKRQIEQVREQFADEGCRVISIMSGNYVQRGIPAAMPKHERARIALLNGADLVLELPFPWSSSPAELFARAGVHIAQSLGGIDYLCFGSESGDSASLIRTAANLSDPSFIDAVKIAREEASHSGESYIKTRARVYESLFHDSFPRTANDILGVEYLRALSEQEQIKPLVIHRRGEESATKTRAYAAAEDITSLAEITPPETAEAYSRGLSLSPEAFAKLILTRFRLADAAELAAYADMSFSLACRMIGAAEKADSFAGFIERCATKKYTDASLRRAALACLFGVMAEHRSMMPTFTNLLAARKEGMHFLSEVRKTKTAAILSKLSQAAGLSEAAAAQYALSRKADSIYELISEHRMAEKPCFL